MAISQAQNWEIKKFADKLKDIVCLLISCTRNQLEAREFKERELGEEWWYYKGRNNSLIPYNQTSKRSTEDLIKPTPRLLLQLIGTDLFRNQLHPNTWVNATMAEYQPIAGTMDVRRSRETFPNWIITDVRFPNEAQAIKDRNGINIRVERPNVLNNQNNINLEHISEKSLDDYKFNYYICNDSSIENLMAQIKNILIKEKLL